MGYRKYRPDFVWAEERVILEVDGRIKYSGQYGKPEDVVRKEHFRQRDLERMGWKVIRTDWNEMMNYPEQLRFRLKLAGICSLKEAE